MYDIVRNMVHDLRKNSFRCKFFFVVHAGTGGQCKAHEISCTKISGYSSPGPRMWLTHSQVGEILRSAEFLLCARRFVQSVAKYLGLTLVFMWGGMPREGGGLIVISRAFVSTNKLPKILNLKSFGNS